jgi:cysteine synthase A
VGIEPQNSPVISQQLAGKPLSPGPHKIQGIGAGFIPEIFNRKTVDRFIPVSYDDARNGSRRLAEQEGILCGISSGAILHASCLVASELGHGKRVLAILPDTGERYLSTPLFADVPVDMTEDELAILRSIPGA